MDIRIVDFVAYGDFIIVPSFMPKQWTENLLTDAIGLVLPPRGVVRYIEPDLQSVRHRQAFLVNRSAKDRFFVCGDPKVKIGLFGPFLRDSKLLYQFMLNALDIEHRRNSVYEA